MSDYQEDHAPVTVAAFRKTLDAHLSLFEGRLGAPSGIHKAVCGSTAGSSDKDVADRFKKMEETLINEFETWGRRIESLGVRNAARLSAIDRRLSSVEERVNKLVW